MEKAADFAIDSEGRCAQIVMVWALANKVSRGEAVARAAWELRWDLMRGSHTCRADVPGSCAEERELHRFCDRWGVR